MEGNDDEARRALERVQHDNGFESLVNAPIGRTGAWVEYPCMCGGSLRLESTRLTDGTWTEPKLVHA